MSELFARPLTRALVAAVVVSGLGIAINVATDLKSNLLAWFAVVALTLISAFAAAAATPTPEDGGNIVDRETSAAGQPMSTSGTLRWANRRTRKTRGVVLRREIETQPDGTRFERVDYFSVEVALKHLTSQVSPDTATVQPPVEIQENDAFAKAAAKDEQGEIGRTPAASHGLARGIGKAALRDASLDLVRSVVSGFPDIQLREVASDLSDQVILVIEDALGARVVIVSPLPWDDVLHPEPMADMPMHWAVLLMVLQSNQVRCSLETVRPTAAFVYRSGDKFIHDSLRVLLTDLLRESRELLERNDAGR